MRSGRPCSQDASPPPLKSVDSHVSPSIAVAVMLITRRFAASAWENLGVAAPPVPTTVAPNRPRAGLSRGRPPWPLSGRWAVRG
jgi:hypothetical protein